MSHTALTKQVDRELVVSRVNSDHVYICINLDIDIIRIIVVMDNPLVRSVFTSISNFDIHPATICLIAITLRNLKTYKNHPRGQE